MKKFTFLFTFILMSLVTQSQWYIDDTITFDKPDSLFQMDPSSGNIWQIGIPSKTHFNQAYSLPDAIVTDTLTPYPINSFSTFTVKLWDPSWNVMPMPRTWLTFYHKFDTDTLHDGGYLETSYDNGHTWTNAANDPYGYFEYVPGGQNPTIGNGNAAFTGRSYNGPYNGWNMAYMFWCYLPSNYDSICLLRFVFYSDNISENREGWMIDNITMNSDICEGIQEVRNDNMISLHPVPASDLLTVKYPPNSQGCSVQIFDVMGKLTYRDYSFSGKSIDVSNLPNGIYLLKYSDNNYLAIRKFIIRH